MLIGVPVHQKERLRKRTCEKEPSTAHHNLWQTCEQKLVRGRYFLHSCFFPPRNKQTFIMCHSTHPAAVRYNHQRNPRAFFVICLPSPAGPVDAASPSPGRSLVVNDGVEVVLSSRLRGPQGCSRPACGERRLCSAQCRSPHHGWWYHAHAQVRVCVNPLLSCVL